MAFQVELSAQATQDIEEHYVWIQERSPAAAEKWFNGIMIAIDTLKDFPERCSKIPEQDSFTQEVRHFIYQKHRIIFTVQNSIVYILAVRHTARKPLENEDLEEVLEN
ncbi:MAG: type II toxin-antitoxin system RelE/ParE family toxin [Brasilonema angustatum HA4187-MV1]|jgi:plasmid stabilization system protein ParE|nr:type II toxin-antitoxin system RelE/ParE family toxin [Brasilonema angustatum HA4187-MV1]